MEKIGSFIDLISGEEKALVVKGSNYKPEDRFLFKSNYRKAAKTAVKRCRNCYYNCYYIKCKKLGVEDCTANNINPDWVCDFWRKKAKDKNQQVIKVRQ